MDRCRHALAKAKQTQVLPKDSTDQDFECEAEQEPACPVPRWPRGPMMSDRPGATREASDGRMGSWRQDETDARRNSSPPWI